MPDFDVEVTGNETASITLESTGTLDVEVELQNVLYTGSVLEVDVIEVSYPGPVIVADPTAVRNRGNVPGIILLEAAEVVPGGTPAGTVVLRKP